MSNILAKVKTKKGVEAVCRNTKKYNLTKGKAYKVQSVSTDKERLEIINDKGLTRFYARDLFTEKVVVLTDAEVYNSICVVEDELQISLRNGKQRTLRLPDDGTVGGLSVMISNVSCGIRDLVGINELTVFVRNFVDDLRLNSTTEFNDAVAAKIYACILNDRLDSHQNVALITASTNMNFDDYDFLSNLVIDGLHVLSATTINNPNSGNDIIHWVIDFGAFIIVLQNVIESTLNQEEDN